MSETPTFYGGIDPSAGSKRPSGCVILDNNGRLVNAKQLRTDQEILEFFINRPMAAIGIDAPQGLPLDMGLCCLEDQPTCSCPSKGSRLCERELRARGYPLFPVSKSTFKSAKQWIRRGLLLFLRLQTAGISCYEIYPNAVQKILFPDQTFPKPKSSTACRKLLQSRLQEKINSLPPWRATLYSDHILDAMLTAFTAYSHLEQNAGELIGDPKEGCILLPRP